MFPLQGRLPEISDLSHDKPGWIGKLTGIVASSRRRRGLYFDSYGDHKVSNGDAMRPYAAGWAHFAIPLAHHNPSPTPPSPR